MAQQDNPKLTITLTGRAPVTITKEAWGVLASAKFEHHDGKIPSQAFRHWTGRLTVRSHDDGRAIVYGVYEYDTQYEGERNVSLRHGVVLPADTPDPEIPAAITRVAAMIADDIGPDSEYASRMLLLAHECIADLPAEDLD